MYMKKVLGLALLIGFSLFATAKKYQIELQLEVGETYHYTSSSSSTIVQEMNGQENTIELDMEAKMIFTVLEETDKGYRMDVQYGNISNSMTTQMGEMSFNSDGEGEDAMSMVFKALTEQTFQVELSYSGEVLGVTGIDQMWENAMSVVSELSDEQAGQLLGQLKESFGEKSFIQSIQMAFDAIPEGKVKIGDEWTKEGTMKTTITMNTASVYQLKAVEDDVAILSVTTAVNTDSEEIHDLNNMQVRYEMGGVLEGTVRLSLSTGWLVKSEQTQEIKGTMELLPNDFFPEGNTIPMTMEQNIMVTGGVQ